MIVIIIAIVDRSHKRQYSTGAFVVPDWCNLSLARGLKKASKLYHIVITLVLAKV